MRIGIYNRYWSTRGGGERYAGVVAETLSHHYPVELIGSEPIDVDGMAQHLGLDLSRVDFLTWPKWSERRLAPLTATYDLFINCTYLSKLRSKARKSAYVVLFPQRTLHRGLVRIMQGALDRLFTTPSKSVIPLEGFYDPDLRGCHWSRERAVVVVTRTAFDRGAARMKFGGTSPWPLQEAIHDIQAPGLDWEIQDDAVTLKPAHAGPLRDSYRAEISCKTFKPHRLSLSHDSRDLGVCLEPGDRSSKIQAVVHSFLERFRGWFDTYDPQIADTYELLISISEFTRKWVLHRWNQPSTVLPPPVDISRFSIPDPSEKSKVLLSVGRFFHGSHNKKHREMLKVFRKMYDRGDIPEGWEYHVVGNLHRDRSVDIEYFAELKRLADGYPVKLLVDLPLDRLIEEYRRAFIFWHAAGWGENERRRPEKLEHFGLTTCEAMSSGCIPVVIAKAGQLEIVEPGTSGFLFTNARELSAQTRKLIQGYGQPWTRDLMRRAEAGVQRFGTETFKERLWEILESQQLLSSI